MSKRLEGRVAVVTGGAGGIGQTIARCLADEGADVAVADIGDTTKTRGLVEASGRQFISGVCDVSNPDQVAAFAGQVHEELGGADIVVNNAGIAHILSIEDTTFEMWQRMFAINVNGCFLVSKAFLPQLKASRAGRIVNVSSTAYWQGPPSFSAYVSTKGAINGFTHTLAADLGPHGVTVNAVAPHLLRTAMTLNELPDQVFDIQMQHQNVPREQTTEDVAKMVAFLASDDAEFITGQIHVVDGGLIRR